MTCHPCTTAHTYNTNCLQCVARQILVFEKSTRKQWIDYYSDFRALYRPKFTKQQIEQAVIDIFNEKR